ncbi:MAG: hydrogenase maturation nickel metallochaperone HypA [Dehalococcoidia bacterium]|nr:hydrogenase maturation nickel metallochaperone HypA [Dehalococcoidia bacterium]MDD5495303.1 hydrogenase maturation nickel metallochaperone HypA [Dehalococcoidia bacterium]
MHEMGVAQNILDIAVAAAQKEGAQKITRINMIAGELRGIVPMQLSFCFGIVAKDSIASGAYLNIEEVPVTAHCENCNSDFAVEEYQYICPKCGSTKIQLTGGTELRIKDIEIE